MNTSPEDCPKEVLTVEGPLEVCPELCPDAVDIEVWPEDIGSEADPMLRSELCPDVLNTEVNPEDVSDEDTAAKLILELSWVEVVLEETIVVGSTEV